MINFKNSDLKLSSKKPTHIIIHHTHEIAPNMPTDTDGFTLPVLQKNIYSFQRKNKLGYHIIIERFKADYFPIVCQPWFTDCHWDDLDKEYDSCIHIAFSGNFELDMLMDRAYRVLAFQLLVPLSRYFRITKDRIVLHKEISNDKTVVCPGEFFDRNRMEEYYHTYYKKGPSIAKN